ncbi:hypothetical protein QFZ71_004890 [Streptomyces sp. V2I9]|nr:hypothetical protein [Streptomyces sp. V2I9]
MAGLLVGGCRRLRCGRRHKAGHFHALIHDAS